MAAIPKGGFMNAIDPRNEPVVWTNVVIGLILSGFALAGQRGWISWGDADATSLQAFLQYAVPIAFVVGGAFVARNWTTPLARPRDKDKTPLVPEDQVN